MKIDRPIAIAVILFAIALLVFFLAAPEYNTFKKLQADLGEKKAQYNAEFDYYAEITKKYYELKNLEDDLKKVDNALPRDSDLGKLVYYFQKTATDSGMLVRDLFLSSSTAGSTDKKVESAIKEMVFSMSVMGNYSSLGSFLSSLEKSDRIFEIISISFSTDSSAKLTEGAAIAGGQIQQIYNFNLQIKTHSY